MLSSWREGTLCNYQRLGHLDQVVVWKRSVMIWTVLEPVTGLGMRIRWWSRLERKSVCLVAEAWQFHRAGQKNKLLSFLLDLSQDHEQHHSLFYGVKLIFILSGALGFLNNCISYGTDIDMAGSVMDSCYCYFFNCFLRHVTDRECACPAKYWTLFILNPVSTCIILNLLWAYHSWPFSIGYFVPYGGGTASLSSVNNLITI